MNGRSKLREILDSTHVRKQSDLCHNVNTKYNNFNVDRHA